LRLGINLHVICLHGADFKKDNLYATQIEDIIEQAPEGFEVLSGDDSITFELLTIGAQGVISVIGNAYPKEFGSMVHNALTGDYNNALKMHRELSTAYKLLSADGNPAGIKSLLGIQGKTLNKLRLPLVPAREETYKAIEKFVKNFEA
jgi:4-hydroxy-tetrahydrodipicolinate synthase